MKLSHGLDTAIGKPVFNSNSNSERASSIHNQQNYHSTVSFFPVPYRLLPPINLHSNFNPHIKTHLSPIPPSQTPAPNPSFPISLHDQALKALSVLFPPNDLPSPSPNFDPTFTASPTLSTISKHSTSLIPSLNHRLTPSSLLPQAAFECPITGIKPHFRNLHLRQQKLSSRHPKP